MKDNAHLSRSFTPILVFLMRHIGWVCEITINFGEYSLQIVERRKKWGKENEEDSG